MPGKVIALDLDDVLNNFTETLRGAPFARGREDRFPEEVFQDYLRRVRNGPGDDGDLLSTEFTYFRARIHWQCFTLARPRPDGVAFTQWLRRQGWKTIICTSRDLRRAHEVTRGWLAENEVPFDHLFNARNKIAFCALWGIRHLVDDDPFNIAHGARYGVQVHYPRMAKHEGLENHGARAFASFEEVKQWIQERP
jgi:hypothetical protein